MTSSSFTRKKCILICLVTVWLLKGQNHDVIDVATVCRNGVDSIWIPHPIHELIVMTLSLIFCMQCHILTLQMSILQFDWLRAGE